jgi:putative hydrolases of HD superfamily
MADEIKHMLEFVSFTHDIRNVKRAMWVRDEEQFENDSEHSYQLAIIALYVIEKNKLNLDPFRAMGLAIVHDILEVYTGDTSVFNSAGTTKAKKEKAAMIRIKEQWPDLKLMHELLEEYESKSSAESKFIYALDKLVPMLNNYLDNGRSWKRQKVNLEDVIKVKRGKIDIDPIVELYYKQILKMLEQRPDLFSA